MDFDWSVIWQALPELLKGARLTIFIALVGLVGGMAIGTLVGLVRAYGHPVFNWLCFIYVELIRGTPIIVQVMFIYFALPLLADVRIDPLSARSSPLSSIPAPTSPRSCAGPSCRSTRA